MEIWQQLCAHCWEWEWYRWGAVSKSALSFLLESVPLQGGISPLSDLLACSKDDYWSFQCICVDCRCGCVFLLDCKKTMGGQNTLVRLTYCQTNFGALTSKAYLAWSHIRNGSVGLDCLELVEAPVQLLQGLEGHSQESLVRHVRRVKGSVRLKEEVNFHFNSDKFN